MLEDRVMCSAKHEQCVRATVAEVQAASNANGASNIAVSEAMSFCEQDEQAMSSWILQRDSSFSTV
eukprot:2653746-Pleurochrysis_carterae.AAC.2